MLFVELGTDEETVFWWKFKGSKSLVSRFLDNISAYLRFVGVIGHNVNFLCYFVGICKWDVNKNAVAERYECCGEESEEREVVAEPS